MVSLLTTLRKPPFLEPKWFERNRTRPVKVSAAIKRETLKMVCERMAKWKKLRRELRMSRLNRYGWTL